jgi:two-component system response regulator AtoC
MFDRYEWPGNVRELENMIKRFVILQDEQLVMRELSRPRVIPNPSTLTTPAHEYTPAFHAPPSPPAAMPPAGPIAQSDEEELEAAEPDEVPAPAGSDGRRLAEVAREAAQTAERAVISDTLRQVHWNRRKAAQLLGVSYKTLLNKIKETGIERP